MKKKELFTIGAIVLAVVLGVVLYPHLRWFQFTFKVREAMSDKGLGRFPTSQHILDLEQRLKIDGKDLGFETMKIEQRLEERNLGAINFWYLKLTATSGSHSFTEERRIETQFDSSDHDNLEQEGVKVAPLSDE